MNVVLSICRKVIVNDQGNLLDINPTRLRKDKSISIIFQYLRQMVKTLYLH